MFEQRLAFESGGTIPWGREPFLTLKVKIGADICPFLGPPKKIGVLSLVMKKQKTQVGFHCGHASTTHKVRWNVADVDSLV